MFYQSEYNTPPISDYLKDFYAPIGGVEPEYLEGSSYVLCECDVCRLIFQRDIPNEALMDRLYERWIDPEKIFNRHEQEDDLGYYSSYAQEVMQVMPPMIAPAGMVTGAAGPPNAPRAAPAVAPPHAPTSPPDSRTTASKSRKI